MKTMFKVNINIDIKATLTLALLLYGLVVPAFVHARENFKLVNVEPEKLHEVWDQFAQTVNEHQNQSSQYINWLNTNVLKLLERTFHNLVDKQNIFYITSDLRKRLNLDKKYCTSRQKCSIIKAFYIPLLDIIFIDESIDRKSFMSSLFHEIVHAYQYRYLLPLDATKLVSLSKRTSERGKRIISENKIIEYIMFRYEAQAHWYQTSLNRTSHWFQDADDGTDRKALGFVKIFLGLVVHLATGSAVNLLEDGTDQINAIMPDQNKRPGKMGHFSFQGKSAFKIPELTFARFGTRFNLGSNVDLNTHITFYSSLGHTYFEEFPFEISPEMQMANSEIVNQYYSKVVNGDLLENSACEQVFDYIENQVISPLLGWALSKPANFKGCSIYESLPEQGLDRFFELLLDKEKNTFRFHSWKELYPSFPGLDQETIKNRDRSAQLLAIKEVRQARLRGGKNILIRENSEWIDLKYGLIKDHLAKMKLGDEGTIPELSLEVDENGPHFPFFIQPQVDF